MMQEELNKLIKDKKVNMLELEQNQQGEPVALPNDDFVVILEALRRIKRTYSTAPTLSPRNFYDQIQFYKSGTDYRIYFFVGNAWHYATLT